MSCKLLISLLISIFALTNAGIASTRDCLDVSRNRATNVTVDVSGCDMEINNVDTCKLVRGKTYYLTTKFTPTANISGFATQIWGVINGMKIPFGKRKQICSEVTNDHGPSCAENKGLVEGYEYRHVSRFPVQRFYPLISLLARIMYSDSGKSNVICMDIPVIIVSG